MKNINEYLSTKTQHKLVLFPETPSLNDMLDFLKFKDFNEIEYKTISWDSAYVQLKNAAQKTKNGVYMYDHFIDGAYWLRFCHAGNVYKGNPIMFCRLTTNGDLKVAKNDYIAYNETCDQKFFTYKDFREEIKKLYDW